MKLKSRDGLALPMVILLMGFMTAAVMAAFTRVESEGRTVEDQSLETAAFALAQAGLEHALADGDGLPRDTIYSLTGGTARVRRIMLRGAPTIADTAIWLLRSTGTVTPRPGRPAATRDVAQWAYRARGSMQVLSSWTSLSGLYKAGVAGDMTGTDGGTCADAAGTTLAGVAVPSGTFTGHDDAITGDPPIREMGTPTQMADQIKIDWVGMTNPLDPAIQPTHIYCPGGTGYDPAWGPCTGYPPSTSWSDPDFWPVILVNGSTPLPSPGKGRGTLIVTGDLTFGGADEWNGIILVGNRIIDNGSGNISGAVVSGLNVKKGMTVGLSSRANGTKDYTYNSCDVARAANAFARMIPMRNAWLDSWPGWLDD